MEIVLCWQAWVGFGSAKDRRVVTNQRQRARLLTCRSNLPCAVFVSSHLARGRGLPDP